MKSALGTCGGWIGVAVALGWTSAAGNLLINGDFAAALSGWQQSGAVAAAGGAAVLADEGAARSLVYQGVAAGAGLHILEFEFRNLLAAAEPTGFAKDALFASLYMSDDPVLFDPVALTGFSGAVPLLDLDALAFEAHGGQVEPGMAGAGYFRYSTEVTLAAPATVFVVFDLVSFNGVDDDSVVLVDNVVLAVPEPLAALPAGLLAVLMVVLGRRRR